MKITKKAILILATFTFLIIGGTVAPDDGAVVNRPPIGG